MIRVADHFMRSRNATRKAERDRRKWFIAARERRQLRDQQQDASEAAAGDLALAVMLATPVEIEDFRNKLDAYDAATVEALMENERLLGEVNEKIRGMLRRAHKLDDGRRVFKTRDGKSVFDEDGQQIGKDVIDPDHIGNDRPYWEDYQNAYKRREALEAERHKLGEFQQKLDQARERTEGENLTKKELDDLDRELSENIPMAVAKNLPAEQQPKTAPNLMAAFKAPSMPMQSTATSIAPSVLELH